MKQFHTDFHGIKSCNFFVDSKKLSLPQQGSILKQNIINFNVAGVKFDEKYVFQV